jgi:hypothetical protein
MGDFMGNITGMMIVDDGQGTVYRQITQEFLLDEGITNQVAQCFRPVGVPFFLNQLVIPLQESGFDGYPEPDEFGVYVLFLCHYK